jgi:LPXTG-site transpeptidase (sortase) family protein
MVLGVDGNGTMQSPTNPVDVAWYRFSARPGQVGNMVMAGHVDYANYGPAVFWFLQDLVPGDEIRVTTETGAVYSYRVTSLATYPEATAPVAEIVGPTDTEMLTLITCAGTFNRSSRAYDRRLVVRAERVN